MKPNKLINETSPYLLQHAYNPVNWMPWSEEAFNLAKEANKPVFISIGYSTCHWCHVMEKESFTDTVISELLNSNYICIKVDREELSDVDHYYMEACQLITGRGGWPLSIFASYDKKPFFAGTYFPKNSHGAVFGFKDLLLRINELWRDNHSDVLNSINEIQKELSARAKPSSAAFNENIFTKAYEYYEHTFDSEQGGFGSAPKFPASNNLLFLLRFSKQYKNDEALHIVETTVRHICMGGIFDHVGFGFHRYSTDRNWLVPHFEKMLYDQVMMVLVLTELYTITKSTFYKYYLEKVIEYVLRDLSSPEGAFYSAEDADSGGIEGSFYVWSYNELIELLTPAEIAFLEKYYGVKREGNFADEASGRNDGMNILNISQVYLNEFEKLIEQFEPIRNKLLSVRKKRVRPQLDNKILTDWNGLFIYALSKAGFALNINEYITAAKEAYGFIVNNLFPEGSLYHSITAGKINPGSMLDDYAFMGLAGFSLFEITGETAYLKNSIKMADTLNSKFYDKEKHLFRLSPNFFSEINYSLFDNAYPAGNSAAYLLLSRLNHITGNEHYGNILSGLTDNIPEDMVKYPSGFSFLLQSLFDSHFNFKDIIITYRHLENIRETMDLLRNNYLPNKSILLLNENNIGALSDINPFYSSFNPGANELKIYVCDKDGCSLPDNKLDILKL